MRHDRWNPQGDVHESTIITGEFSDSPSKMAENRKYRAELYNNTNQLFIMDISTLLYSTTAAQAHMEHLSILTILYTYLNKFKRIKLIQCLLLDLNGIKLEIINRKIAGRFQNIWRLNNTLVNNIWV